MVQFLGTDHRRIECTDADVGRVFPEVIWHTEWPVLRTAPAPMYLLSGLVQQNGLKVVLTGEGADEFLGGYNIFKEAKLRHYWARDPDSSIRPLLLKRLYPYVQGLGTGSSYLEAFFRKGLDETDRPEYSHAIRWANNTPLRRFFSSEVRTTLGTYDPVAEVAAELEGHPSFGHWTPLAKAQFIEASIFMSEYLLSSQGDRMLSAHSIEGRFPFLDHRVIEFASQIPPGLKIRGLNEKYVLKRAMRGRLPDTVRARAKRPYRAPIQRSFFSEPGQPASEGDSSNGHSPEYVQELLSPEAIQATGYFEPRAVSRLVAKDAQRDLSQRTGQHGPRRYPFHTTHPSSIHRLLSWPTQPADRSPQSLRGGASAVKRRLERNKMTFHKDVLQIDAAKVTDTLVANLRNDIRRELHRSGAIVGISGGIDSSVVLALCVRALGAKRVVGIMMPEKDSSGSSIVLARKLADQYGVETVVEDMTGALVGWGCYRRRDEAIQRVFPEYDPSYKVKIGLPQNSLDSDALNVFYLTIISPQGEEKSERLGLRDYLQIVAASNFKQRSRMAMLYYHAELRNYAVAGTPNKDEHDQGFFVKWGDGGYDLAPIRHLFKTQVYQLAEYLDVPLEIRQATPSTDTYSAHSSQQEFFFQLPFELMDLLWYAQEHDVPVSEVAQVMDLTEDQVRRAYRDLEQKHRATEYLRMAPRGY